MASTPSEPGGGPEAPLTPIDRIRARYRQRLAAAGMSEATQDALVAFLDSTEPPTREAIEAVYVAQVVEQ